MKSPSALEKTKESRFPRLTALRTSAREDYNESRSKPRTWLIGSILVGSQIADRLRFVILTVPPAVVATMEQTNNSVAAGAVGAGMFAAWSMFIGESTLRGVDQFPKTVDAVNDEFPAVVDFFADALPGIEKGGPTDSAKDSVLSKMSMRTRRSASSLSFGTSPFVSTARATGYSTTETRKLYANTGIDGAGLVFALGAATTEGVKRLAMEGQYQTAQNIQNILSNNKTWWAVAGASIAAETVSNKLRARKTKRDTDTRIDLNSPE